jgi:hypothetical protein
MKEGKKEGSHENEKRDHMLISLTQRVGTPTLSKKKKDHMY